MNTLHQPVEQWQIVKLHTLLSKLKLTPYKLDIMNQDIEEPGRYITSSKELRYAEAQTAIDYLMTIQAQTPEGIACDVMRKKIISCCRERGMTIGGKADMRSIYQWVFKYGYLKKALNKYTYSELPQLVTQAESMRDSFYKSLEK